MKTVFLFFIFFSQALLAAKEPSWLVKIESRLDSGATINGTGYIVKIGDDFFVKTASHVTLGKENFRLTVNKKQRLDIFLGDGITNNSSDDQLIRIKGSNHSPLGVYSPGLGLFVIPKAAYRKMESSKRKKYISAKPWQLYYLVPSWTKGKPSKYSLKTESYLISKDSLYLSDENRFKLAHNKMTAYSRFKAVPGESGSPLMSTVVPRASVTDLSGRPISVEVENSSGFVPVIFGHVHGYARGFKKGSMTTYYGTKDLVELYLSGKRGAIDEAQWKYRNGVFFRELSRDGNVSAEAYWGQSLAGDAVGANGGDGVGANGGDGIGANGGDGNGRKSALPKAGMLYKNSSTPIFNVINSQGVYPVYANWDNMKFLESESAKGHLSFSPVSNYSSYSDLIDRKVSLEVTNTKFGQSYETSAVCKFEYNNEKLYLHINGLLPVTINLSKSSFSPLVSTKHEKTKKKFNIDIRGLYSIDMSDFSKTKKSKEAFAHFSKRTFVKLGSEKYDYTHYNCYSFQRLMSYQKK